jgi:RIO-like serine/threonine protein kinase
MAARVVRLLKQDIFGRVEVVDWKGVRVIRRVATGGKVLGSSLVARMLARHEHTILARLHKVTGVPRPLGTEGRSFFYRSYVEGAPLYEVGNSVPASYWTDLLSLARRCHRAGVSHNDLAKEANILVTPGGLPAFIDFQVAIFLPPYRRIFKRPAAVLQREDRRHLLKHKALYRPDLLSTAERKALSSKSLPVRIWWATGMKPTERLVSWLGWQEQTGPRSR